MHEVAQDVTGRRLWTWGIDTRLMPFQTRLSRLHAEAAIDLDNDSPLRGASAMVPADEEPASVRIDKHGGTWSVRRQASNGKSLADIVKTEWENVPHQMVRRSNIRYVYCRAHEKCGMVVRYTLEGPDGEEVLRESKKEHSLTDFEPGPERAVARELTTSAGKPSQVLIREVGAQVARGEADAPLPSRRKIRSRRSAKKTKIPEGTLQELENLCKTHKPASTKWGSVIIGHDSPKGYLAWSSPFWAKRFREQLPHFRELGIQMALDATRKISSSDYKFFALGFLAMHIGKKARLDVFPPKP